MIHWFIKSLVILSGIRDISIHSCLASYWDVELQKILNYQLIKFANKLQENMITRHYALATANKETTAQQNKIDKNLDSLKTKK